MPSATATWPSGRPTSSASTSSSRTRAGGGRAAGGPGQTTRQIAAATGVSQPTAARDLTGKSGNESRQRDHLTRNESNDHEDEAPVVAAEKPPEQVPGTVTGP